MKNKVLEATRGEKSNRMIFVEELELTDSPAQRWYT